MSEDIYKSDMEYTARYGEKYGVRMFQQGHGVIAIALQPVLALPDPHPSSSETEPITIVACIYGFTDEQGTEGWKWISLSQNMKSILYPLMAHCSVGVWYSLAISDEKSFLNHITS